MRVRIRLIRFVAVWQKRGHAQVQFGLYDVGSGRRAISVSRQR
jgi:hypothetical protein